MLMRRLTLVASQGIGPAEADEVDAGESPDSLQAFMDAPSELN
jgi:hypothetical protein